MKTCVFIIWTNGVGKTTLAKHIISKYGGIDRYDKQVTYCKDGSVCLAGKYDGDKYGGVDGIKNAQGSSCTSILAEVVSEGLSNTDTIFCEGSFMGSFGMNLLRAMFCVAKRYLVVLLHTSNQVLNERLENRTNGEKRNFGMIIERQEFCFRTVKKWQSIGVSVLLFDTEKTSVEEQLDKIQQFLRNGN